MPDNKHLLVGNHSKDDAAVYELDNETALIATTDFFMPIVDDPFQFGRIAAANAISDVYAMGGKPLLAIAILGWPVNKIPAGVAQKVIEGGRSICLEAGIPLAGGHSIDSPEPIFGLAVNGIVTHGMNLFGNTDADLSMYPSMMAKTIATTPKGAFSIASLIQSRVSISTFSTDMFFKQGLSTLINCRGAAGDERKIERHSFFPLFQFGNAFDEAGNPGSLVTANRRLNPFHGLFKLFKPFRIDIHIITAWYSMD